MATVTGSGTAAREISSLVKAASEWTSKAIVISANTKTRTRDLMVPLVARECGKIGQITRPETEVLLLVRFPSAYEI